MLFHRISAVLILGAFVLLIDLLLFRTLRRVTLKWPPYIRWSAWTFAWFLTTFAVGAIAWYYLADVFHNKMGIRQWLISTMLVLYLSKLFAVFFIFVDDAWLGIRKAMRYFRNRSHKHPVAAGPPITRSQFLSKAALAAAGVPFSVSVFGILHGAYDYRIRRKTIYLPGLPRAFDGIRIAQISDIHANANYHKVSIQGGVDMLMNEKADVIFFTGDLVNYRTREVDEFIHIFDKIRAPLGVYAVTGNHDYGEYIWWYSPEAKQRNFEDFKAAHKQLGYDLLLNEHRFIETGGEKLAVIGVENWGTGRFPKYGRLDLAYAGAEEAPVKLLLSHDPSHWDAHVRPHYPDIDVMFAGHTHGFQMGVEIGDFRWSPAQYRYKQWAGLYQEGAQYLYVNRGFGCIGYLGRIGMPPELTIVELKKG